MSENKSLMPARGKDWTGEGLDLLKRTVARGITDDEFALFAEVCRTSGLNPFMRQIHAVAIRVKQRQPDGTDKWMQVMSIQVGIDGLRLVAQRSREYEGQVGPMWCGEDGAWRETWLATGPPSAARVGIWRAGFREPAWGVARFASFAQYFNGDRGQQLAGLWAKMPAEMLAKCAESQALRKAFPQETSGLYIHEEMEQADNPEPQPRKTRIAPPLIPPSAPRPAEIAEMATTKSDTKDPGTKTMRAAFAAMNEVGVDTKDAVAMREYLGIVLGREIQSRANLSADDWKAVADDCRARMEMGSDAETSTDATVDPSLPL